MATSEDYARLSNQLSKLSVGKIEFSLEEKISTDLEPGDVCPRCERLVPRTMLEFWLQQKGGSFENLCRAIADEPNVRDLLGEGRSVSKNLIFRINHQEPGWEPSTRIARLVQASILRRTGFPVELLQNRLPNAGGYSCRLSYRNTRKK